MLSLEGLLRLVLINGSFSRLRPVFFLALPLALVLFAGTASAQDVYDEWGGLYHAYHVNKTACTPAPSGYKPFYISHIGRHGSRYPVNPGYVGNGLDPLRKADSLGVLSAEGRRLMEAFARLDSISQGTYGLICPLGAEEQQAIARRMAAAYPRVFRQKGRDSVACYSTHKQRAILSMTNFAAALASAAPKVHIGFVAGEKYYDYLCREDKASSGLKGGSL